MPPPLERYAILELEDVLPRITSPIKDRDRPTLHDVPCHVNGLRFYTFKTKGVKCVSCGIVGDFFAIERPKGKTNRKIKKVHGDDIEWPHHLNLYALDTSGKEILMTHDHIIARGLGGRDIPENAQPMCAPCNSQKSRLESAEFAIPQRNRDLSEVIKLREKWVERIKAEFEPLKKAQAELFNKVHKHLYDEAKLWWHGN